MSQTGKILLTRSGKISEGYKNNYGYKYISIKSSGKKKNFLIHRLVALTFIPNKLNKPCINHIDGNKENNDISNLEWCTHKENMIHATKHKLCTNSSLTGENHNTSKHTDLVCREIRNEYSKGVYTMRDLASIYNTSSGYISDLINNKIRIK